MQATSWVSCSCGGPPKNPYLDGLKMWTARLTALGNSLLRQVAPIEVLLLGCDQKRLAWPNKLRNWCQHTETSEVVCLSCYCYHIMLYVICYHVYIYIMLPYKHHVGCQGWHRVILDVRFHSQQISAPHHRLGMSPTRSFHTARIWKMNENDIFNIDHVLLHRFGNTT